MEQNFGKAHRDDDKTAVVDLELQSDTQCPACGEWVIVHWEVFGNLSPDGSDTPAVSYDFECDECGYCNCGDGKLLDLVFGAVESEMGRDAKNLAYASLRKREPVEPKDEEE